VSDTALGPSTSVWRIVFPLGALARPGYTVCVDMVPYPAGPARRVGRGLSAEGGA